MAGSLEGWAVNFSHHQVKTYSILGNQVEHDREVSDFHLQVQRVKLICKLISITMKQGPDLTLSLLSNDKIHHCSAILYFKNKFYKLSLNLLKWLDLSIMVF